MSSEEIDVAYKSKAEAAAKRRARYAANSERERELAAAWRAANSEKHKANCAAWRAANPEKNKAQKVAWRTAKPEKAKATKAAWAAAHPEKAKARHAAWRAAHPEKAKARHAAYYASHKEEAKARDAAWRAAHPEEAASQSRRRRARKRQAEGTHTASDIKDQYTRQKGKCFWCGGRVGKQYHVDHVVPLSRGGGDGPDNLVIACAACNLQKGDKLPHEWAKGGRLL